MNIAQSRSASPPTIELTLLGQFELTRGAQTLDLPLGSQRVLAMLALEGRCLYRAQLAGTLWFNSFESRAQASLRSALWRIRVCGPDIIEASREKVRLIPNVLVDVDAQVALARQALDPVASDIATFKRRTALEGELLPGWYDEWVALERERLRHLRLNALEALASKLTARGLYGDAVETAMLALRTDPLRESGQRVLIEAHLAAGNSAEALAEYGRYRNLLERRYGLEPSEGLRGLVAAIPAAKHDAPVTRA